MTDACVTLEKDDGVAIVALNRPEKRNALNMDMFRRIDQVSRQLRTDRTLRAVIVTAKGEDFCSGLDVKSVLKQKSSVFALLAKWWPGRANLAQRVSYNWRRIPAPVIMVIQGRCWGGGLQIALGADFRFAAPDASFSVMEGKWGLIPDMAGNLALREILSQDAALQLAMTAEIITAKTAADLGLISGVSNDPMQRAMELVNAIKERSPDTVAAVKKLYRKNWFASDWRMLANESWYQVRIILGKNQARAVKRQMEPGNKVKYIDRNNW